MLGNMWLGIKRIKFLHTAMKNLIGLTCEAIPPLGRIFYNLSTSPAGLDFGTGNMAKDWDAFSRKNARWYVTWDAWKTEEEFNAYGEREVKEVLLKDISLDPSACVLDIGCGLGRLLKPISAYVREAYGVDISKEMILKAKERMQSHKNIFLSVTDGALSNIADNQIDYCYTLKVFRHIPEKRYIHAYISEASRVLKPEGIFKFEVWGARWISRNKGGTIVGVSFKEEEIRAKLKEHNFNVLSVDKVPEQPYVIYTAIMQSKDGIEPTKAIKWTGACTV